MDLTASLTAASRVIDRWLAYKTIAGRLPGLSAGIVYKNTLLFQHAYGYADVEQQRPTSATTGYRIASFSKTFTAIAIMQLAEQGGLEDEERARMHELQVKLDQYWDLLRQRRARREFGLNPEEVQVRDPNIVEHYQQ